MDLSYTESGTVDCHFFRDIRLKKKAFHNTNSFTTKNGNDLDTLRLWLILNKAQKKKKYNKKVYEQ